MSSVVVELQRDALDRNVHPSDLLRKALVIARKLDLKEFQEWIDKELNGYGSSVKVPAYREVTGQIRGWNPYHGWVPVIFSKPEQGERLSLRPCGQSTAELEHLLQQNGKDSSLHIPFSQETQHRLSKGFDFQTEVTLFVPFTAIVRIIDAVRTIILNWALQLEKDGILGEELSFSLQEKDAAEKSSQNITNFYGPVQNPQFQQGGVQPIQVSTNLNIDLSALRSFLEMVRKTLGTIELPPDERREAEAELRTVESQIDSPKPKSSIITAGLESLRRILEGAGGSAAGQLLIELGKLMQ